MQGVSLINDPQGQPKILTIDIQEHDHQLDPLVIGLLKLVQEKEEETERADWRAIAHTVLNRAYGDDEPDYDDADLLAINPSYQP